MAKANPSRAQQTSESQPGFEQALAELEQLIEKIESGEIGLEECLTHYERGMKLVARCQQVLGQAHQRIARLRVSEEGSLEAAPGLPGGELSDEDRAHD